MCRVRSANSRCSTSARGAMAGAPMATALEVITTALTTLVAAAAESAVAACNGESFAAEQARSVHSKPAHSEDVALAVRLKGASGGCAGGSGGVDGGDVGGSGGGGEGEGGGGEGEGGGGEGESPQVATQKP